MWQAKARIIDAILTNKGSPKPWNFRMAELSSLNIVMVILTKLRHNADLPNLLKIQLVKTRSP